MKPYISKTATLPKLRHCLCLYTDDQNKEYYIMKALSLRENIKDNLGVEHEKRTEVVKGY